MSAARLLFGARAREAWNGMRRETGLGRWAFAGLAIVLTLFMLVQPLALCAGLGHRIVAQLDGPAAFGAELFLGGLHAAIVIVLGAVGGIRTAPQFHPSLIAALPISPVAHGIAELLPGLLQPASLVGAVCTLGFAIGAMTNGWPLVPAALLLAAQTVLGMLLVTGAVRIAVAEWRRRRAFRRATLATFALGAALWGIVRPDGIEVALALLRVLPTSQGVAAYAEILRGEAGAGTLRALVAVVPAVLLAPLVATRLSAFARRLRDAAASGARDLGSFKGPVRAVASVFFAQVWRTKRGRAIVLMAPFLTAMAALGVWIFQRDPELALPKPLIDVLVATPWLAWTPVVLAVFLAQDIWSNLFGWDRRGLTGLLLLPVDALAIVRGKLLGYAALVAVQCALALPPLLFVHVPDAAELCMVFTHTTVAVLAVGTIGLDFSLRYPRPVAIDTSASTLPWSLMLVPPLLAAIVVGLIGFADLVGRALLKGVPGAGVIGVAVLAVVAWSIVRAELPRLAARLAREQERLVTAVA